MSKKVPQGQLSWIEKPADQLSWLDIVEPAQIDEDDLSYTDKDFIPNEHYPHMPEYIVVGQTCPDLEWLAEVLLGSVHVFKDNKKDVFKYYGVTTAIIGNKVWAAFQFDKKLVRYTPHPMDTDDDE